MKKILLVGEKYSSNLGDGVICNTVEAMLSQYDIKTCDLSSKQKYNTNSKEPSFSLLKEYLRYVKKRILKVKRKAGLDYKNPRIIKYKDNLDQAIRNYKPNYIIFAGGQIFSSSFADCVEYTVSAASKANIPVLFNSCGIGDLDNKTTCDKIRNALDNNIVKYISIRDGYDKIQKLKIHKAVYKTYDSAILVKKYLKAKTQKSETIGVGIMLDHNRNPRSQISYWSSIIDYCQKSGLNWRAFCNGNEEDYAFAKYIFKKLNIAENRHLSTRPTTPDQLLSLINEFDSLVTARLHSSIVAYSFNIPTIGLEWDQKVKEFYTYIASPNNSIECYNHKTAIQKIKSLQKEKYDKDRRTIIEQNIAKNIKNIINTINE